MQIGRKKNKYIHNIYKEIAFLCTSHRHTTRTKTDCNLSTQFNRGFVSTSKILLVNGVKSKCGMKPDSQVT